jgi:release factor glutamine methyltransferase
MIKINYKEYCLSIPEEVYLPSEDTYLLLETIQEDIKIERIKSTLEIGTGSGYISLGIYNQVNNLIVTDINPIVITYFNNLKKEYKLDKMKIIKSNLFNNLKKEEFDLIIFNPPYVSSNNVPKDNEIERLATDGGSFGRAIILKFLKELKEHLSDNGACYLLISSFNNPHYIFKQIIKYNLCYKVLRERNIFFEKLIILKITNK